MNPEAIATAVLAGTQELIAKALAPIQAENEALRARMDELQAIKPDDVAAEAAKRLIAGDGIKSLIDLQVAEYMAENPPPQGEKGDPGEAGKDGRNGLDVKDLFRAEGGRLVAVMSDGTAKDLGQFVGADGKDGLGFEDMEVVHDGEGMVIFKFGRPGLVKEFPIHFPVPTFKGYWKPGHKALPGHVFTHKGNAWIARVETDEQPTRENKEAWQILAAKGNDGRDGRDLTPRPDSVKLNG